ncbi:predicted protein [Chaetoceros tenuissimus]|uniref:Uncharacterized protein n=1 Tax=Chaetoceros tenuissimus TaxID=426638 RepID=A0AAD3D2P3_9STRA|nr:predicted protein [Chaetoceros tenuissimus]
MRSSRRAIESDRPMCNGYVCMYDCDFSLPIPSFSTHQHLMEYKYEVYASIDSSTDLTDAISEVESKILSITSSQMGLKTCNVKTAAAQFTFSSGYNWIYKDFPQDNFNSVITSMSSAPSDNVDKELTECKGRVNSKPVKTTCIPISGLMKVGYFGIPTAESDVEHSLLNLIERGAREDWFTTDRIQKVVYTGTTGKDYISDVPLNVNSNNEAKAEIAETDNMIQNENNPLLSGAGIGIIVAAICAIVLGTIFLAKKVFGKNGNEKYISTPSPNQGKKFGLRAYDSECIRANFDDDCLRIETPKHGVHVDPFESPPLAVPPSTYLEAQLNDHVKYTDLSRVTEGSRESGSSNMSSLLHSIESSVHSDSLHILSNSVYTNGSRLVEDEIDEDEEYEEEVTTDDVNMTVYEEGDSTLETIEAGVGNILQAKSSECEEDITNDDLYGDAIVTSDDAASQKDESDASTN